MGYVPIGQLWNIMDRCKGIRFLRSLRKSDLWHRGAVLLITVPSVGKSLRLLAHQPIFVHVFHPHSQQARLGGGESGGTRISCRASTS